MAQIHLTITRFMNTGCLLAVALSVVVLADEEPHFDRVSREQFPALMFIQEDVNRDPTNRSSLMLATFDSGKAVVQQVLTAQYVKAVQLSDSVFLLEADYYPPDDHSRWKQTHFLVNFQTGSCVLLSRSESRDKLVHLWCLRSVPDKNQAVILRYGQGTDRSTLIHIDLRTLETTSRSTLSRTDATRGFDGPNMKISPDFRLLAAMFRSEEWNTLTTSERWPFSLRVFNLETMETTELDRQVMVEVSPLSSSRGGTPPFEWISDQDILYQHMIPEDANENGFPYDGQYVLKCANIKSKKITEWARNRLRLTGDGGHLQCDWLTGEMRYHDFIIDTRMQSLLPYRSCYSVKYDASGVEIRFHDEVLYHHSGRFLRAEGCASRTQEHFAYFVRFEDKDASELYAKTRDMKRVVEVAKAPFYTTLVTWIEDTSKLRNKQPNKADTGDGK